MLDKDLARDVLPVLARGQARELAPTRRRRLLQVDPLQPQEVHKADHGRVARRVAHRVDRKARRLAVSLLAHGAARSSRRRLEAASCAAH